MAENWVALLDGRAGVLVAELASVLPARVVAVTPDGGRRRLVVMVDDLDAPMRTVLDATVLALCSMWPDAFYGQEVALEVAGPRWSLVVSHGEMVAQGWRPQVEIGGYPAVQGWTA